MGFGFGTNAYAVVSALASYPKRKRIRDGFIKDLQELRPDIELTESDAQRLLIRTRTSLTRFEFAGLYRSVQRAVSSTDEAAREIRNRYLRALVSNLDSSSPQLAITEVGMVL